jgi:acid phosphatase
MPADQWRAFLSYRLILLFLLALFTAQSVISVIMRFSQSPQLLLAAISSISPFASAQNSHSGKCKANTNISLKWHPPSKTSINNLSTVINGTGVYGFIFNSSQGPQNTYNWCNMPHTNSQTYPKADKSYKLEYVEVIHRHHKRTPYADNAFPQETYPWFCDDEGLFYGGKPINPYGNDSASTYWDVYTTPSNPLRPEGFNGTCQFPQITRGGLDDSHQHGVDLKAVYSDLLNFIPSDYDLKAVSYRVTNNIITSQVASMLIAGMYPSRAGQDTPLLIQPDSIDSLEPAYICSQASSLYSSYGPGSSSPAWVKHLNASAELKKKLDGISGVNPNASDWSMSWDHYFDNLSSRLCHDKPLPCNIDDPTSCVTMAMAEEVFRVGEYEYSFIYRDSQHSLPFSRAEYGIWVGELAQNLRHAMGDGPAAVNVTSPRIRYRHNVAHDGSVSPLVSILQIEQMVWPGMGAEVVFELYSKAGCFYLRVLWGGQVLESSHPGLGRMDMVPIGTVLAYFDGLVGVQGAKVPGLCETPECAADGEGCADDGGIFTDV